MLMRITVVLALLLAPVTALAQSSVLPYYYNSSGAKQAVGSSFPLPVTVAGGVSANLSPFTPGLTGARGTPLTVTTSDSSGNLPTNTGSVIVSNVGSNPMYCNVNAVAATVADQYISSAGGWFNFGIPAAVTTLRCIATGGSTTANSVGGSGLGAGTGGGSGGSSSAITTWAGGTLGAMNTYGTTPGAVLVPGMNAFVTNTVTVTGTVTATPTGTQAVSAAIGTYAAGALATGAGVDGWDITQGAKADTACAAPTSTTPCSEIALMKGILDAANTAGQLKVSTTGGATPQSAISVNNVTAVVVKASAGTLYGAQLGNIGSVPLYLKIYNATSATCGSGTPVKRLIIPKAGTAADGGGSNISFGPMGIAFGTGITYCLTAAIADNDTTAPAANVGLVNLDWN